MYVEGNERDKLQRKRVTSFKPSYRSNISIWLKFASAKIIYLNQILLKSNSHLYFPKLIQRTTLGFQKFPTSKELNMQNF